MLKKLFLMWIVLVMMVSTPIMAGSSVGQVILEESFENLRDKKGWHVETGMVVGDHGVVWNTHKEGLELERGIVSVSSDGEVHAELDAHHNVKISTNFVLEEKRPYEISFDIKPRSTSNSPLKKATSAMLMKIGKSVLKIHSNKIGKLRTKYKRGQMSLNLEEQANGWTKCRIKVKDLNFESQKLIIKGIGKDDSYGMLLDNIKISYSEEDNITCGACDGKINTLTLKYQGEKSVLLEVKKKKGGMIFSKNLEKNENFSLNGFDKKGTLGTKIFFYIDGEKHTQIHTSCSEEILVGMVFGDFLIREGSSRNGGEICTLDGYEDTVPPIAIDQNLSLEEDSNISFTLEATDENGLDLTYTLQSHPHHGILSGTAPHLTYIPNPDFHGEDSLSFTVNNGTFASNISIVSFSVKSVNDTPLALAQELYILEDTAIPIVLIGTDSDADQLSFTIVLAPLYGTLSGIAPNVVYVPNTNYHGIDSFSFKVNDGNVDSHVAMVSIVVDSVNDAPLANDDNVTTLETSSVAINPLSNDTDIDSNISNLNIVSITQPSFGHVLLSDNFVYYAPGNTQATSDQITYTIEDEEGAQATATINITIIPVNEVPISYSETVYTDEETSIVIELNASDPDGDDLNYTIIYSPENGNISDETPTLTYTPNKDFNANDYIVFLVTDGEYESYVAVVSIIVNPLNDPPVANTGEDYIGIRGDTVVFDASDSYDVDGTIIAYQWKDGTKILSTEKIFEMQMMEEGVSTITLVVTDDKKAIDSDEKIITIKPCCEGCIYPDPTQTNPYN